MSKASGSWGARRATIVALLAFCLAFPAAARAASSVAPIVGKWQSSGAVVNVTPTGASSFQGKIVSGTFGSCPGVGGNGPGGMIWNNISGSGFSYSGTIPWVRIPECTPLGEGKTTFALTSVNSGTLTSTSPDGSKTESASMTRVGKWPGADSGGSAQTNCKKNGQKVLCAGQKKVVKKAVKSVKKTAAAAKGFKSASVQKQAAKLETLAELSEKAAATVAEWLKQKLPKSPGKSKAKLGNPTFGKIYKQQKSLSKLNAKVAAVTDAKYADPAAGPMLENSAQQLYSKSYGQLTPAEKSHVNAQAWTSSPNVYLDPDTGKLVIDVYSGAASVTVGIIDCPNSELNCP